MAGRGQVQAVTGGERPVPGLMLHCLVVPRKNTDAGICRATVYSSCGKDTRPAWQKNSDPWGKIIN